MTACLDPVQATTCPVTCKTCPPQTTATTTVTTSGPCHDTNPQCFEFSFIISGCSDPDQAKLCPQMCGLCSPTSSSEVTTALPMTTAAATTMATTQAAFVCEDKDDRCVDFEFLLTACLDSELAKTCPKMCNVCPASTQQPQETATTEITTVLTTTSATTTTIAKPCHDTDPQCFDFNFIMTGCADSEKAKLCPQMCGLCTETTTTKTTPTSTTTIPLTTTTAVACVDTDPRCFEFDFIIAACADPNQSRICPRMCQLCDASSK